MRHPKDEPLREVQTTRKWFSGHQFLVSAIVVVLCFAVLWTSAPPAAKIALGFTACVAATMATSAWKVERRGREKYHHNNKPVCHTWSEERAGFLLLAIVVTITAISYIYLWKLLS